MPSTATLAFFAASSMRFGHVRDSPSVGYAASSVVVTTGTRCLSTSSNSGSTPLSDELVHSTATSGFDALIVLPMSTPTFTRSLRVAVDDDADVLPDLQRIDVHGADDAKASCDAAICLATAAPIGPRPTWRTRIMQGL